MRDSAVQVSLVMKKQKKQKVKIRKPLPKRSGKIMESNKDKARTKRVKSIKADLTAMSTPVIMVLDVERATILANFLRVEIEERRGLDKYLGGGVDNTLRGIWKTLIDELERSGGSVE